MSGDNCEQFLPKRPATSQHNPTQHNTTRPDVGATYAAVSVALDLRSVDELQPAVMEHRSDDLIPSIRARLNASTANIPKLEGEVTVAQERLRRELNVVEKLRELLTLFEADTPTMPQSRVEYMWRRTMEVQVEARAVLTAKDRFPADQTYFRRRSAWSRRSRAFEPAWHRPSQRDSDPSSERRADGSRTGPYGPFGRVLERRTRQVCV